MVCCVLEDKTGVTKTVTDKEVLGYLKDANAFFGRQAFEVEERTYTEKRWFRKLRQYKHYALYWDIGGLEWQLILCASGRKETVCAFLIGHINGIQDVKKYGKETP